MSAARDEENVEWKIAFNMFKQKEGGEEFITYRNLDKVLAGLGFDVYGEDLEQFRTHADSTKCKRIYYPNFVSALKKYQNQNFFDRKDAVRLFYQLADMEVPEGELNDTDVAPIEEEKKAESTRSAVVRSMRRISMVILGRESETRARASSSAPVRRATLGNDKILKLLHAVGYVDATEMDARDVIAEFDTDGGGDVSLDEFLMMIPIRNQDKK